MIERTTLPGINAFLNGCSGILLVLGYLAIRAGKQERHKALMLGATAMSGLFLASYLTHHAMFGSTKLEAQGWIRPVYFTILLTHTLLAAVNLPLVLTALWRALKGQMEAHKAIARWTLGIWLYVSVTGVLVYLILYQLYPPAVLSGG